MKSFPTDKLVKYLATRHHLEGVIHDVGGFVDGGAELDAAYDWERAALFDRMRAEELEVIAQIFAAGHYGVVYRGHLYVPVSGVHFCDEELWNDCAYPYTVNEINDHVQDGDTCRLVAIPVGKIATTGGIPFVTVAVEPAS